MSSERYSVITCDVTGRLHYGLLVRAVESGEAGYIDRAELGNSPLTEEEWPVDGTSLRCVVLGYTRDGRLRLSSKPRDVSLSESGINVREALGHWISVRDAGESHPEGMVEFLRLSYATSILSWALQDRPSSANYKIARWAVSLLPPEAKDQVVGK
jgi:hypothetical protein